MHGSTSPGWLLVALCAVTGAYCLLRTRSAVEEQRRAAGGEALMGFGMAAMAVPAAVMAPPRWAWGICALVFGAAAMRAVWAARAGGHHLHHLVGSGAMAYMAAVMSASPSSGHHGHGSAAGPPAVTGVLALYFAGYVLWSGARLIPAPTVVGGNGRVGGVGGIGRAEGGRRGGAAGAGAVLWRDRLELARACRLSMAMGMLAMLLMM
ncbi:MULTISPECIES: DUF5134 domain-containing protein [unclassified Streptomyces]|uniref:DUF5134 domain-containing protein n=1 Tax=unclassified Streptomyces TaxID=2593676 RepID=UPI0004C06C98|nr:MULTISPECIES: DUF5134 domain-containing protein [unclassified Streptomyces]